MVCALLRHIDGLWTYYLCFPKLGRLMERRLVIIWGGSSDEARVLSFLILRRIVIASPHTKQERMEKLLKVCMQLVNELLLPAYSETIVFQSIGSTYYTIALLFTLCT